MINRQEFDKIKEKIERKKDEPCYGNIFIDERNTTFEQDNERLLEIIQYAEEFGAIDGRRERQEANTIALRKVLTDCGFKVQGMGFGDMLYELRKALEDGESEAPVQSKVLDADGIEIKPGETLYYIDETILCGKMRVIKSVNTKKAPNNSCHDGKPWVEFTNGGWDFAHLLTHKKPETLQDVIEDTDKSFNEYWGCTDKLCNECPAKINGKTPDDYYKTDGNCHFAMRKDTKRRLKAIAKRIGGDGESKAYSPVEIPERKTCPHCGRSHVITTKVITIGEGRYSEAETDLCLKCGRNLMGVE